MYLNEQRTIKRIRAATLTICHKLRVNLHIDTEKALRENNH